MAGTIQLDVKLFIKSFGGPIPLAEAIKDLDIVPAGVPAEISVPTIRVWSSRGAVPSKWIPVLLYLCAAKGKDFLAFLEIELEDEEAEYLKIFGIPQVRRFSGENRQEGIAPRKIVTHDHPIETAKQEDGYHRGTAKTNSGA